MIKEGWRGEGWPGFIIIIIIFFLGGGGGVFGREGQRHCPIPSKDWERGTVVKNALQRMPCRHGSLPI